MAPLLLQCRASSRFKVPRFRPVVSIVLAEALRLMFMTCPDRIHRICCHVNDI